MLIHEFITLATEDTNHTRNESDLVAFLTRLSGFEFASVEDGQLYGPFHTSVAGDVHLFVGKVSRNLRACGA